MSETPRETKCAKQLAEEYITKNPGATSKQFITDTGLSRNAFSRAQKSLGIVRTKAGTKTQRLVDHLRINPNATNKEMIKLFHCGRTTCNDARAVVDIWEKERFTKKPKLKDLVADASNYHPIHSMAWV